MRCREGDIDFHFVDRVVDYEPHRWVRATATAVAGDHFQREGASGAEVDPMMALEALGQAGDWLLMLSNQMLRRGALISIGRLDVMGRIQSGDTLELEGVTEVAGPEIWVMSGSVAVEGRPVLQVSELMCVLIGATELEASDSLERRRRAVLRPAHAGEGGIDS